MMGRSRRAIPDGWEKYNDPPMGSILEGTRFICFKTPLSEALCNNKVHKENWFTTQNVMHTCNAMGRTLGLVIDLTNTDRYYDPTDFHTLCVDHFKLTCPGHEVHQRPDIVHKFIRVVSDFEDAHADDDLLIGVHCTHGVNRTGYLVCRYLIERKGWTVDKALEEFRLARGYGVERATYRDALATLRPTDEMPNAQNTASAERVADAEAALPLAERKRRLRLRREIRRQAKRAKVDARVAEAVPLEQTAAALEGMVQQLQQQMPAIFDMFAMRRQQAEASASQPQPLHKSDEAEDISEDDEDEDHDQEGDNESSEEGDDTPDLDKLGKIDKSAMTKAQQRRERRKRLEKRHRTMQRGKFWEIREMQKEQFGF